MAHFGEHSNEGNGGKMEGKKDKKEGNEDRKGNEDKKEGNEDRKEGNEDRKGNENKKEGNEDKKEGNEDRKGNEDKKEGNEDKKEGNEDRKGNEDKKEGNEDRKEGNEDRKGNEGKKEGNEDRKEGNEDRKGNEDKKEGNEDRKGNEDKKEGNEDKKEGNEDRKGNEDKKEGNEDRKEGNEDRKGNEDKKEGNEDRKEGNEDRKGNEDKKEGNEDRKEGNEDRKGNEDKKEGNEDRKEGNEDRKGNEDKKEGNEDRKEGNEDRKGNENKKEGNEDKKEGTEDKKIGSVNVFIQQLWHYVEGTTYHHHRHVIIIIVVALIVLGIASLTATRGSALSAEGNYKVTINVFDKKHHGPSADLSIIFHGDGQKSDTILIRKCLPEDVANKTVSVGSPEFGNLEMIELWRVNETGYFSEWFVTEIKIERLGSKAPSTFPLNKWIKQGQKYRIRSSDSHTSLPQKDSRPDERYRGIKKKQEEYEYHQFIPGGPVQVKNVPKSEKFSLKYQMFLGFHGIKDKIVEYEVKIFSRMWNTLDGIPKVLYDHIFESSAFPKPKAVDVWRSDEYFGQLRLTGANPSVIKLCTSIPQRLRDQQHNLKNILEGNSLDFAMDNKKLFFVDLKIMENINTKDGFVVSSPIAWFYAKGKQLLPIAIQLKQSNGTDNPLFLPTDPEYTWMMAKMWFNNADAAYHESIAHLGFTHLIMEGFVITTHRNLAPEHPLFKLLLPHFLFLISINRGALNYLIGKNEWVENSMNIGRQGMFDLIRKKLGTWRLDTHGTLPKDLEKRGVIDKDLLPGYYFRDDALDLYHSIERYVSSYIDIYYESADDYIKDYELQNWAAAIVAPRSEGQGQGILGVPGNGRINNKKDLCTILTCIIYTSSVGHASVNFMQYDQYGFPPAYPAYLKGKPPVNKDALDEKDILNALPGKSVSLQIMFVTKLLSGMATKSLGNFEVQYITDKPALEVLNNFREDLKALTAKFDQENGKRTPKYDWLNPKNVPNAISI